MSTSSAQPSSSSSLPSPTAHSPETTRQIAEARAALEASILNIGSSLDGQLKSRAANLHANDAALTKQQKDLEKETENLRKETDKLKKLADEGQKKVKELGNVQNWAELLERDFLVLEETMRLVERGEEGDSEWDTESGSESEGDEVVVRGLDHDGNGKDNAIGSQRQKDADGDTQMHDLGASNAETGEDAAELHSNFTTKSSIVSSGAGQSCSDHSIATSASSRTS
ncbi:hypothetical protein BP6252_03561 [Coleophoma cylindrospora]|uniref:Biogenesis of lysosome-related organelles complex 1 subunit 1 n=1 Tax=Coleophoma cylindrospora TaxID=1849047 RepID=A0A3D8S810_9HELO|nr:hypothetical protein BP6252_03561 [Coleophoma cylindrospora]